MRAGRVERKVLDHFLVELTVRELKEGYFMLVLSRKLDEEIVIAGNIIVKVISISGNRVRLGITAAEDVRIERPECADRPTTPDMLRRRVKSFECVGV